MGQGGGHGRAGGKRNQGFGGGASEGKRTGMPLQGKKKQLGLPDLGVYSNRMEKTVNKQKKRQSKQMSRHEEEMDRKRRRIEEIRETHGDAEGVNRQRGQFAALALKANHNFTHFEATQEFLEKRNEYGDLSTNRSKENSKKRFWKEFQKVVKVSDVLLEVLDARDPLGCRLGEIERTIESQFAGKKKFVLVLNKVDLVPKENILRWLEYFRTEGIPVIAFSAAAGGRVAAQETSTSKTYEDPTHRCVHHLLETLKQFQRTEQGGRRRITVGIVGFPNVGKSSVINALKRERVVGTGNTPGVTTTAQEISLQGHVKVVDCPGVVISDGTTAETALRNAAKIEHLDDVVGPCELIMERCGAARIRDMYRLPQHIESFDALIAALAEKKGKLLRGGKPNIDDTCKVLLKDWNDGRIPYYTMPPADREFIQGADMIDGDAVNEEATILDRLTAKGDDFICLQAEKQQETTYMVNDVALFSRKRKQGDDAGNDDDDDDISIDEDNYNPFKMYAEDRTAADTAGGCLGEGEEPEGGMWHGAGEAGEDENDGLTPAQQRLNAIRKQKLLKHSASVSKRRKLKLKLPIAS